MKIFVYDTEKEQYKITTLEDSGPGKFPVCTVNHFFDTVLQLFEDITPNSGANPMYQDVNWQELKGELNKKEDGSTKKNKK